MKHVLITIAVCLALVGCVEKPQEVVFFGSSVCNGVGAEEQHGYAYLVGENLPQGWQYQNISVNGNNTFDLFARFDRDLVPTTGKYVVIGVSLGNEGLHETGERAVLSYRENMPRLIRQIHDLGRVAIVTNNYSRADFNAVDFEDLCQVNLEVQQWDVPTVNLLGNIDDGAGHWAPGYDNGEDIWHPNTAGHREMSSAFVPSMWRALEKGKPLPVRKGMENTETGISHVQYTPEAGLRSYTLSYISGDKTYTIVHSTLRDETLYYENTDLVRREADDTVPELFDIEGENLRQILLYRAAMTEMEIAALVEGKMLRSSLELYCPLTEGDKKNYAQSTSKLKLTE